METHIAGFSDDATLLGLEKATLLDVRGVEGPGEVADNPSPKGAVNATWDTLNMDLWDRRSSPPTRTRPWWFSDRRVDALPRRRRSSSSLGRSDVHNAGGVDRVKRMFDE